MVVDLDLQSDSSSYRNIKKVIYFHDCFLDTYLHWILDMVVQIMTLSVSKRKINNFSGLF
ncbi:hypothetical protein NQ317_010990 [Molorchus minor]|uniref:Uncharacterized protein n=1 Tax=Molorchus minor TaxID=1323400 RepID=A0ABQ9K3S0_9CUCU|nr:hypothetical protein NQ317_010990 [Molorchus minor]